MTDEFRLGLEEGWDAAMASVKRGEEDNLFHAALTKVHDIAKNGTRNTAAWCEVLEVVEGALARRLQEPQAAVPWDGEAWGKS